MHNGYSLSPKEFAAVSSLEGAARVAHFIKRAADWQVVWGLRDQDGWVSANDGNGNEGLPIWPHPNYAAACATKEWEGNSPAAIDVELFVNAWLPNMATKNAKVIVFPTPELRGVFVDAVELQSMLIQELSQYE